MAAHDLRVIVREKEMREQQRETDKIQRDRLKDFQNVQQERENVLKKSNRDTEFILLCFVDSNTLSPKVTPKSLSIPDCRASNQEEATI